MKNASTGTTAVHNMVTSLFKLNAKWSGHMMSINDKTSKINP